VTNTIYSVAETENDLPYLKLSHAHVSRDHTNIKTTKAINSTLHWMEMCSKAPPIFNEEEVTIM